MKRGIFPALILCAVSTWAQLLAPFTAAEGVREAMRAMSQAGITALGVDAIYTSGDTSLLSALGGPAGQTLTLRFDFQRGTNTMWLYSTQGKTSAQRDTTILYAVIKVVAIYQSFPLFGIPGLDQLAQLRGEQLLPATFMNSNVMAQKLWANATFQSYRALHPQSILLGANIASVRRTPTSSPQPLWSVMIGEGTLMQPTDVLNCFIPAADTSGTAQCFEVPFNSATSYAAIDEWSIFPNPANDIIALSIPERAQLHHATIDIATLQGDILAHYTLSTIGAGNAITIPTSSMANGAYILRYRSPQEVRTLLFMVAR